MGVWPLAATIFFVVSGGPYTAEQVVGKTGPMCGLLILAILPLVWALPIGLMTAELSSAFPEEGGYFNWVQAGLGPFAAFLCAWWSWTSSWVDLALYPLIAIQYLMRATGPLPHAHAWVVAIILVFTVCNLLGIKTVGRLSLVLFLVLLVPFLVLVVLGLTKWVTSPPHFLPLLNAPLDRNALGAAIVLGLWNYFGWDSLTVAAGEVVASESRFPKAILLAVGLVTGMVVLPVAAGVVLNTQWSGWASDKGYWPEIAASAWPPLRDAMIVGGVLSNVGLFAANLLASSRIPYVLAGNGFLPKFIVAEHPRFGTPWVALAIGAALSAVFARESFDRLVAVDLSLYLAALVLEFAAWMALRRRGVLKDSPFVLKGGSFTLMVAVLLPTFIAFAAIVLQLSPATKLAEMPIHPALALLLLLATGPLVYFAGSAHRRRLA